MALAMCASSARKRADTKRQRPWSARPKPRAFHAMDRSRGQKGRAPHAVVTTARPAAHTRAESSQSRSELGSPRRESDSLKPPRAAKRARGSIRGPMVAHGTGCTLRARATSSAVLAAPRAASAACSPRKWHVGVCVSSCSVGQSVRQVMPRTPSSKPSSPSPTCSAPPRRTAASHCGHSCSAAESQPQPGAIRQSSCTSNSRWPLARRASMLYARVSPRLGDSTRKPLGPSARTSVAASPPRTCRESLLTRTSKERPEARAHSVSCSMNCLALAAKSTVRGCAAQYCISTETSTVSLSVGGSAGQRLSVGGATARRHGLEAHGEVEGLVARLCGEARVQPREVTCVEPRAVGVGLREGEVGAARAAEARTHALVEAANREGAPRLRVARLGAHGVVA
eukprot:scaffold96602_cov75-Phaeocystis_antarctica.AAC.2